MSLVYKPVDVGLEARHIFWSHDSVDDHIGLCDYETTLPMFLENLPKDEIVLDAGCGLARWVFYLRQQGYRVIGTDVAHAALAQAMRHNRQAPLFCSDTLRMRSEERRVGKECRYRSARQ